MRVQNRRKFRPVLDAMESRQLLSHVAHVHHAAHVNHAVNANHAAHVSHMTHVVAAPTPTNKLTAPVQANSQPPKPSPLATATLATQVPAPGSFPSAASTISTTSIRVLWGSSQYATAYSVMIRPFGSSAPFGHYGDTSDTSMTLTGLSPATRYEIYVTAFNSTGATNSNLLTISTSSPPTGQFYLTATPVSTTGINLNWTSSQYATRYDVMFRPAGSSSAFQQLGVTVPAGVTSMTTTGLLSPGTRYQFYVVASGPGGSTQTSMVTASTLIPVPGSFSLTATPVSTTEIDLNWTSSQYATDYMVMYRPQGSSQFLYYSDTYKTSIAVLALSPATNYEFYVVASNSFADSQTSVVTATTATPAPAPGPLTFDFGSNGGIAYLTWTSSQYATHYQVYIGAGSQNTVGTINWALAGDYYGNSMIIPGLQSGSYGGYVVAVGPGGTTVSNFSFAVV